MKKKYVPFQEIKENLIEINLKIDQSKWEPDIILSVNRGGCVPGVFLSHIRVLDHEVISFKNPKNKNDGIDFTAQVGTRVVAADTGVVATVTEDTNQIAIVVLKHPKNILTVYANLTNIQVSTNQNVLRGEVIGEIPEGDPPYLHFEIREGFESIDPLEYLNEN